MLHKIRSNYDDIVKKVGETAAYPGNWIYETWSESGRLHISKIISLMGKRLIIYHRPQRVP